MYILKIDGLSNFVNGNYLNLGDEHKWLDYKFNILVTIGNTESRITELPNECHRGKSENYSGSFEGSIWCNSKHKIIRTF